MWESVEIVTIAQALAHIRRQDLLAGSPFADDVQAEIDDYELKLRVAHELVLDHVERADDSAWTAEMTAWTTADAPRSIVAAVLIMFQHLVRFRGDDEPRPEEALRLPPEVVRLLLKYHTPAIA